MHHHTNNQKNNIPGGIMKTFWIILVATILATSLMAAGTHPIPVADTTNFYDRIRNVIAVDNSPEPQFFVATFGLDNYDMSNTDDPELPAGKEAKLVRFKVKNGCPQWSIVDLIEINMNQNDLN